MYEARKAVQESVPRAKLDTCPYRDGENGIGWFVRNGTGGHFISDVRKTPKGAWTSAATKLRAELGDKQLFDGAARA